MQTPPIYCLNHSCTKPRNPLGRQECENCQTPLIYHYLWATGPDVAQIAQNALVNDRYYVVNSQIWLDTKPGQPPDIPEKLPDSLLPYLHLFPQKLHIPEVFGLCNFSGLLLNIILLDNVPIDPQGQLYPTLIDIWGSVKGVYQVYWLWQIIELWTPLVSEGVAASLLSTQNLRVDSWRVRLLQLIPTQLQPSLRDLAESWQPLIAQADQGVKSALEQVVQMLRQTEVKLDEVKAFLNRILLEQAALLPLQIEVFSDTDTGPEREHNEDSHYPTVNDLEEGRLPPQNQLLGKLAIICDGVGGHEGGEVASQLAIQSVKTLAQNLLKEVEQQTEIAGPDQISRQLEEVIRIANNLIANENDRQGRELRQRMGTTLVMALQVPQKIKSSDGTEWDNSHELYIANVGDSRAYWLTENSCLQLTLDDDLATREVRMGRSIYYQSLQRLDAGALTQAVGTREAESLHPTIERFLIVEDGLLLLCSDGLSDRSLVERSWTNFAAPVLQGKMSLETAVKQWIKLANQENGHDNSSIVLLHCRVSPAKLALIDPKPIVTQTTPTPAPDSELSESAKALLYGEVAENEESKQEKNTSLFLPILTLIIMFLLGIGIVWYITQGKEQTSPKAPSPKPASASPKPVSPKPSPSPITVPTPKRS